MRVKAMFELLYPNKRPYCCLTEQSVCKDRMQGSRHDVVHLDRRMKPSPSFRSVPCIE